MIPRLRASVPAILAALALSAGLSCAGPEASRQLYQWSDADGNVRYTPYPDHIPATRRHTRRVVEPGVSAAQNAAGLPTPATGAPAQIPAASPPSAPAPAPTAAAIPGGGPGGAQAELDARIAALEARIETDEEALKTLISDPAGAGSLRDSAELNAIAQRLPGLQKELARLRAQRAAGAGEPAGDGVVEPAGSAGDGT